MGLIHVGVAGWDYPDWRGIVYPRHVDRLAYLARFVDVLEVNSTFYRPIDPRVAASWLRRIARHPGFRFTAKAHRSWTHEPDADLGRVVPETLKGLLPLRDANALGAILLQFPQSFHRNAMAFERLEQLLGRLAGWPIVVEVRHASWDSEEVGVWLRDRGAGWCVVDQPTVGRSTLPPRPRVTSLIGYMRLHGRNVADWFRKDAGRDARYDYVYSLEELRPLSVMAEDIAKKVGEVYVIQNNHFRGKALVNALQFKHLLGARRPVAPEGLRAAYPELRALADADVEQPRLF